VSAAGEKIWANSNSRYRADIRPLIRDLDRNRRRVPHLVRAQSTEWSLLTRRFVRQGIDRLPARRFPEW
jgi:hypothetical protein